MIWPILATVFLVGIFAVHCGWRKKFTSAMAAKEKQLAEMRGEKRDSILTAREQEHALRQLENTRQEFVANVSHELRTPLSLIKGFVETLLDGAKDDPVLAQKFLQTIERHTDRLTYLIDDLLTISKLESGHTVLNCQRNRLAPLVEKVREDLQARAAEKKVWLRNEVPAELCAQVDLERLEQVFWNLLDNAIKYGKPGGTVSIGGRDNGRQVEIWVADDGAGIPAAAQSRIFERFYRVDKARSREQGGTGLGLAIVKHVVQAHGGDVWVKSEMGRGTTFHFTLRSGSEE